MDLRPFKCFCLAMLATTIAVLSLLVSCEDPGYPYKFNEGDTVKFVYGPGMYTVTARVGRGRYMVRTRNSEGNVVVHNVGEAELELVTRTPAAPRVPGAPPRPIEDTEVDSNPYR